MLLLHSWPVAAVAGRQLLLLLLCLLLLLLLLCLLLLLLCLLLLLLWLLHIEQARHNDLGIIMHVVQLLLNIVAEADARTHLHPPGGAAAAAAAAAAEV